MANNYKVKVQVENSSQYELRVMEGWNTPLRHSAPGGDEEGARAAEVADDELG